MSDERVTTEEAQDLVEFITESEKHGSVRGVLHKVVKRFAQEVMRLGDERNEARAMVAGLEAQLATVRAERDEFVARFNAREVRCFGCGGQGWNTITTGDGSHGTLEQESCEACEGKGYVTVRMSGYPRTLCEKCKGDEVSGCICGMVAQERRGCRVCLISNDDGTCDCASFCADCATLEGKAANDPDTCYPSACPKHGGER